MFDEVVAAYHQWDHAGRPPATRWCFTVTPDGQQVELTDITPDKQRAAARTHHND